MKKLSKPKLALIVPLASLILAWVLLATGMYVSLFERSDSYFGSASSMTTVHWSIYAFLAAIVALSLGSLWGQRTALRARHELGQEHALARAVHRFNNLLLWISIGLGVVFVFGNFMSAFAFFGSRKVDLLARILGVYLPIVLATALVVLVILRAFVFRADGVEVDEQDEQAKAAARARRRNLGLGYAVPILTTAFAIVLGLLIYDATKTPLQTWVWVLIQAIVIAGIIGGTRFANRAKTGESPVAKPRAVFASLAAGAANLNLVLSIAFGAVVSIIAIASTGGAIDKLYTYGQFDDMGKAITDGIVKNLTWRWYIEDLAPAKVLVLLVVIGTYLTITLRNRDAAESQGDQN
ncbi:MAG: hypothetical protein ACKOQ8_00295 [Micrococcales bacterium]